MTKRAFLFVLSLFLLTLPVLSDELPQVLQPNTTAYSASEVARLRQAITTLEMALDDYDLGSRRYFTSNDWNSRDFAAYTAGTLSEMGYETKLVSGVGWPDGTHTWLLAGIPLGGRTAWVPVEAAPEMGHSQQILGYIPSTTNGAGVLWFDTRYLNFTDVIELPPNLPPVAKIRPPTSAVIAGQTARFLAAGSSDPDGREIVLYQWDFGDGKTEITTLFFVRYKFKKPGSYSITLTVIDNRGTSSATSSVTLRVAKLEEQDTEPSSSSSGGCGCGN